MVSIYIDAEFDAVKENNKFHQMMISFGAIFERDGEIKTFYSEVKPKGFKALTNVVRRITKLKNEDIRKAPSFPEAMQKFLDWIELKENEVCRLYSLGPDDQRTILQECERYGFSDNLFKDMIDLQKLISKEVTYQGNVISPYLSLNDLKIAYSIQGKVKHNALSDAYDLMYIHQAYQIRKPDPDGVREIVERKERKKADNTRRAQERLRQAMRERFSDNAEIMFPVVLFPEIKEQLALWEERDANFQIGVRDDYLMIDQKLYKQDELKIGMIIHLDQILPCVEFVFVYDNKKFTKRYELQYRNASIVEAIIKRMQIYIK